VFFDCDTANIFCGLLFATTVPHYARNVPEMEKHHLKRSYVIPRTDAGRMMWFVTFAGNLEEHAGDLGLSPEEVATVKNDAAFFTYVYQAHSSHRAHAKSWTDYKKAAYFGKKFLQVPVPVTLPPAPPVATPGILRRTAALIARIKRQPGYTTAIGAHLGIIAPRLAVDVNTAKPHLRLRLSAGQPVVGWRKDGFDSLELHVDRGDGKGLVYLAVTTRPPYRDQSPLPASGTSAVWSYQGFYRLRDQRVGDWSSPAPISVMGVE